jgi:hypothetical protein
MCAESVRSVEFRHEPLANDVTVPCRPYGLLPDPVFTDQLLVTCYSSMSLFSISLTDGMIVKVVRGGGGGCCDEDEEGEDVRFEGPVCVVQAPHELWGAEDALTLLVGDSQRILIVRVPQQTA